VLFAIWQTLFRSRVFFATEGFGAGLLKEIRLNPVDRPISVRRWNMSIPISSLEIQGRPLKGEFCTLPKR
jgi:hypothetical protein